MDLIALVDREHHATRPADFSHSLVDCDHLLTNRRIQTSYTQGGKGARLLSSSLAHGRSQTGQSLVEFALIAPVFFIFLFAIFEAALVINAQATLDNATGDGVRIAALCGNSKGVYTAPDGTPTSVGPSSSPCPQAINGQITRDLGILQPSLGNPDVLATSPAAGSPSACGPAQTTPGIWATAASGCVIDVRAAYKYAFLFNFLVGPGAATITLTSEATAVSQQ